MTLFFIIRARCNYWFEYGQLSVCLRTTISSRTESYRYAFGQLLVRAGATIGVRTVNYRFE